jgi:hypothetical protein
VAEEIANVCQLRICGGKVGKFARKCTGAVKMQSGKQFLNGKDKHSNFTKKN